MMNGNENKMRQLKGDESDARTKMLSKLGASVSKGKSKYEDALNEEIDPPLCLAVRAVGHSFNPGSQPFIPMIKFAPSTKVSFPSCGVGESVYQCLQMLNQSDTPVFYKILQDPTHTFRAFPPIGMVPGKSFALICFEFSPRTQQLWSFTAQVVLNHTAANVHNIHLVGPCYEPNIFIGNEGRLFYAPTYVGVSTKQKLTVKNNARIPLEYECLVPEKYRNEVIFDPPKAVLQGNEEKAVSCAFTPLKKREYKIRVPIHVSTTYEPTKDIVGYYNPGSGLSQKAIE